MTFNETVAAMWLLFAVAGGVAGADPAYVMGAVVLSGVFVTA